MLKTKKQAAKGKGHGAVAQSRLPVIPYLPPVDPIAQYRTIIAVYEFRFEDQRDKFAAGIEAMIKQKNLPRRVERGFRGPTTSEKRAGRSGMFMAVQFGE